MIPILFDSGSTTYTTNGIGGLKDSISCVCTEERNGLYEVELVYPIDGQHASDLVINNIIVVKPCDGGSRQAFRIYQISTPINGKVTIKARHISYQLGSIPTMPFSVTASSSACNQTLQALKTNAVETCPFTFWTDVTTAGSYEQKEPASIRSRLGGVQGSVLDQFGGEFEFDNWSVKLHRQRGRVNSGITLRYGKNITDITQEQNIASTVTGVVPYWIDLDGNNIVTLTEKVVYSQYASAYPYHLTEPLNLSGNWQDQPTETSLRLAAQAYVNKTGLGIPQVNIKVSFVALWQTEQYKDIAPLQNVNLCDEITVEFEKLGISETAKVVKTEYDVLKERYKSIQVGSLRSTLITTLNDQNAATMRSIDIQRVQTTDAVNNATSWLTSSNGYIVAVKDTNGSWKELLFMDTNDPSTARNVLRMNTNGIGFSTTGINGPYTNAWTIDGNLVASFITTGILKDAANQFSLNMETGALTMNSGTFKGTVSGGTISGGTVNGTTINGSIINVGTFGGVDGTLNIYNSSGTILYMLDKYGLTSYAQNLAQNYDYYIRYGATGYLGDTSIYKSSAIAYYRRGYSDPFAYIGISGTNSPTQNLQIKNRENDVYISGVNVGIAGDGNSGEVRISADEVIINNQVFGSSGYEGNIKDGITETIYFKNSAGQNEYIEVRSGVIINHGSL